MMILRQMNAGRAAVENQYARVVTWDANRAAQQAMAEVFLPRPHFEWRGLGSIPHSALRIAPAYAPWDAEVKFHVPGVRLADPEAAPCGDVLKGLLEPRQCALFGVACTPEHPVGALMVSSEGACAAQYRYASRPAESDTCEA